MIQLLLISNTKTTTIANVYLILNEKLGHSNTSREKDLFSNNQDEPHVYFTSLLILLALTSCRRTSGGRESCICGALLVFKLVILNENILCSKIAKALLRPHTKFDPNQFT